MPHPILMRVHVYDPGTYTLLATVSIPQDRQKPGGLCDDDVVALYSRPDALKLDKPSYRFVYLDADGTPRYSEDWDRHAVYDPGPRRQLVISRGTAPCLRVALSPRDGRWLQPVPRLDLGAGALTLG